MSPNDSLRPRAPTRLIPTLIAFTLLALPAQAQPAPPPQATPDWANIETVEVQAQPGPAVWHVTRGDSEVWILGLVGAMPKGLDWNKQYLSDLLDGARAIVMPPRGTAGILEAGWFLITNAGKLSMSLPRDQTLQGSVSPEQWTRFTTVLTNLGGDPARYTDDMPFGAAQRINSELMTKAALTNDEPSTTINKLARTKKVPEDPAFKFEIIPFIKDALNIPVTQQRKCFAEAVEDVDRMSHHAAAAAQAWAVGDIKGVKDNFAESRFNDCMGQAIQGYGDVDQQRVTGVVAAINTALDKPGKTVVVIGMGPLLRRNGILDQLQAEHATIEGPKE